MSRWVRTSCDIFEHEIFAQAELSEREAWLWLIMRAAWKETRHRIGSEVVPVPRGSLFCTLRELQAAWRWKSDFRVRAFLEMLETEAMMKRTANAGKTQITICNYDKYQSSDGDAQRTENATETHGKRTENALKIPVYQDTKDTSSLRSDVEREDALVPVESQIEKPKPRKKSNDLDCSHRLVELGCPEPLVRQWMAIRKAKSARILTETALDALIREAEKAGMTVPQAVKRAVEENWRGFKAEWIAGNQPRAGPAHQQRRVTPHDQIQNLIDQMTGDDPDDYRGATIDETAVERHDDFDREAVPMLPRLWP